MVFGRTQDYEDATVTLIRGVEVPRMAFWYEDRQDATVRLIRGAGIPRTMFWHASGSSNGCLPTN
eukprot:2387469-Pyramimonas_sp.AAC.1